MIEQCDNVTIDIQQSSSEHCLSITSTRISRLVMFIIYSRIDVSLTDQKVDSVPGIITIQTLVSQQS